MEEMTDQLTILEDIKQQLDRMERENWVHLIANLDISAFALNLRRTRDASFPAGYFSNCIWEILLELYQADKVDRRLGLPEIVNLTGMPEDVALRYLDLLMQDGFVYQEDDLFDRDRSYILLTGKGLEKLDILFAQFKASITSLLGLNAATKDAVSMTLQPVSQAG